MFDIFLTAMSAVFLLFIILDLLLHAKKKLKRSRTGKALLLCLTAAFLACGYIGVSAISGRMSENAAQKYLAVKYLSTGKIEQAKKYINILPDSNDRDRYYKSLLAMLADGFGGSYSSAVDKAMFLESTSNLTDKQKKQVDKLKEATNAIVTAETGSAGYDRLKSNAQKLYKTAVNDLFKAFNINDDIRVTYDAVYKIDEAAVSGDFSEQNDKLVSNLLKSRSNEDAYKSAVKYYFARGDYPTSEQTAKELVKKYPTVNNKIVYTDIVTQQARNSLTNQDTVPASGDPEVEKLKAEADKLKEQLPAYDKFISQETDKDKLEKLNLEKSKLVNKISETNKKALLVPIKRAVNYLLMSKPLFGDKTGLIDMQIAKLYYSADEIEKSREYINSVLMNKNKISNNSIIKTDVDEIQDALASANNSGIPPETLFTPAVENIINKMSQNVVPIDQATINGEFRNSVVSDLKYSNLQFFISKVDYSAYPEIKAYVNISGERNGTFGLANDYALKDFVLTDTNYRIDDFNLEKVSADSGANIAVILDHSGSMEGRPFEDAKLAVQSCIENKGKKDSFSVVTYSDNASIITGLNSDRDMLKSSVNMIDYPDGSTNISDGLSNGLGTLEGSQGVRAMILLSDGQDNRSEAGSLDKILEYAKTNGIVIFTIGLGEVDEAYMRNLSEQTGAAYIRADNTTQLYDIYRMLQKYIVNNYIFKYKVVKNPDLTVRKCEIVLKTQGASGYKIYNMGGGEIPNSEETYDAAYQDPNSLWLEQVNPRSLSTAKIDKNTIIKITGRNFDKNMKVMIGSLYSDKVTVKSPTEAEVQLPAALAPGFYPVTLENPDGNRKTNQMAFALFRLGIAKKLKVGQLTVEANSIGKLDDYNYIASGNVIINGIIRCDADIEIHADSPKKLDFSKEEVIELADNGSLEGKGKLYISYSDVSSNSGLFANMVLGGKDFIIRNGKFLLKTNTSSTDFVIEESGWDVKIPAIIDLELNKVSVVSDGIEFTAFKGDIIEIKDALKSAFALKKPGNGSIVKSSPEFLAQTPDSGATIARSSTGQQLALPAAEPRLALPAPRKALESLSSEVKFKATASDLLFKTSVEFGGALPIGNINIGSFKIDIDTIDSSKKYYTLHFGLNTDKIIPGFAKIPGAGQLSGGIYAELGSYYVYPDSIKIGLLADPDKPSPLKIYNVIEITEVNGGVEKLAFATKPVLDAVLPDSFVKKIESDPEFKKPSFTDLTFFIGAEAEVNLLDALHISIPSKKLTEMFEIAEINDARFSLAPFKLDAQMGANMSFLKQEIGNVSFGLNKEEARAEFGLKGAVKIFGNSVEGNLNTTASFKYTPVTAVFDIEGRLKYNILGRFKFDDDGLIRVSYENNIAALEGFRANERVFKAGYNANGDVNFFRRFIFEK